MSGSVDAGDVIRRHDGAAMNQTILAQTEHVTAAPAPSSDSHSLNVSASSDVAGRSESTSERSSALTSDTTVPRRIYPTPFYVNPSNPALATSTVPRSSTLAGGARRAEHNVGVATLRGDSTTNVSVAMRKTTTPAGTLIGIEHVLSGSDLIKIEEAEVTAASLGDDGDDIATASTMQTPRTLLSFDNDDKLSAMPSELDRHAVIHKARDAAWRKHQSVHGRALPAIQPSFALKWSGDDEHESKTTQPLIHPHTARPSISRRRILHPAANDGSIMSAWSHQTHTHRPVRPHPPPSVQPTADGCVVPPLPHPSKVSGTSHAAFGSKSDESNDIEEQKMETAIDGASTTEPGPDKPLSPDDQPVGATISAASPTSSSSSSLSLTSQDHVSFHAHLSQHEPNVLSRDLPIVEQWLARIARDALRKDELERGEMGQNVLASRDVDRTSSLSTDAQRTLDQMGIGRHSLMEAGLNPELIDRSYIGLYTYSLGVRNIMDRLVRHMSNRKELLSNSWQSYIREIEGCEPEFTNFILHCIQTNHERQEEARRIQHEQRLAFLNNELRELTSRQSELKLNDEALAQRCEAEQKELNELQAKIPFKQQEIQDMMQRKEKIASSIVEWSHNTHTLENGVSKLQGDLSQLLPSVRSLRSDVARSSRRLQGLHKEVAEVRRQKDQIESLLQHLMEINAKKQAAVDRLQQRLTHEQHALEIANKDKMEQEQKIEDLADLVRANDAYIARLCNEGLHMDLSILSQESALQDLFISLHTSNSESSTNTEGDDGAHKDSANTAMRWKSLHSDVEKQASSQLDDARDRSNAGGRPSNVMPPGFDPATGEMNQDEMKRRGLDKVKDEMEKLLEQNKLKIVEWETRRKSLIEEMKLSESHAATLNDRVASSRATLEQLTQMNESSSKDLEVARVRQRALEDELAMTKSKQADLEATLKRRAHFRDELQETLAMTRTKMTQVLDAIAKCTTDEEAKTKEIAHLNANCKLQSSKRASLESDVSQLRMDVANALKELQALDSASAPALQSYRDRLQLLKQEMRVAERERDVLERIDTQERKAAKSKEKQVQELRNKVEEEEKKHEQLRNAAQEIEASLQGKRDSASNLQLKLEESRSEHSSLLESIAEFEKQRERELEEQHRELASAQAHLDSTFETRAVTDMELEGAKQMLDAFRSNHEQRIEKKREILAKKQAQFDEEEAKRKEEHGNVAARIDELVHALAKRDATLATIHGSHETLRQSIDSVTRATTSAQNQQKFAQRELDTLAQEMERIEKELQELHEKRRRLDQDRAEANKIARAQIDKALEEQVVLRRAVAQHEAAQKDHEPQQCRSRSAQTGSGSERDPSALIRAVCTPHSPDVEVDSMASLREIAPSPTVLMDALTREEQMIRNAEQGRAGLAHPAATQQGEREHSEVEEEGFVSYMLAPTQRDSDDSSDFASDDGDDDDEDGETASSDEPPSQDLPVTADFSESIETFDTNSPATLKGNIKYILVDENEEIELRPGDELIEEIQAEQPSPTVHDQDAGAQDNATNEQQSTFKPRRFIRRNISIGSEATMWKDVITSINDRIEETGSRTADETPTMSPSSTHIKVIRFKESFFLRPNERERDATADSASAPPPKNAPGSLLCGEHPDIIRALERMQASPTGSDSSTQQSPSSQLIPADEQQSGSSVEPLIRRIRLLPIADSTSSKSTPSPATPALSPLDAPLRPFFVVSSQPRERFPVLGGIRRRRRRRLAQSSKSVSYPAGARIGDKERRRTKSARKSGKRQSSDSADIRDGTDECASRFPPLTLESTDADTLAGLEAAASGSRAFVEGDGAAPSEPASHTQTSSEHPAAPKHNTSEARFVARHRAWLKRRQARHARRERRRQRREDAAAIGLERLAVHGESSGGETSPSSAEPTLSTDSGSTSSADSAADGDDADIAALLDQPWKRAFNAADILRRRPSYAASLHSSSANSPIGADEDEDDVYVRMKDGRMRRQSVRELLNTAKSLGRISSSKQSSPARSSRSSPVVADGKVTVGKHRVSASVPYMQHQSSSRWHMTRSAAALEQLREKDGRSMNEVQDHGGEDDGDQAAQHDDATNEAISARKSDAELRWDAAVRALDAKTASLVHEWSGSDSSATSEATDTDASSGTSGVGDDGADVHGSNKLKSKRRKKKAHRRSGEATVGRTSKKSSTVASPSNVANMDTKSKRVPTSKHRRGASSMSSAGTMSGNSGPSLLKTNSPLSHAPSSSLSPSSRRKKGVKFADEQAMASSATSPRLSRAATSDQSATMATTDMSTTPTSRHRSNRQQFNFDIKESQGDDEMEIEVETNEAGMVRRGNEGPIINNHEQAVNEGSVSAHHSASTLPTRPARGHARSESEVLALTIPVKLTGSNVVEPVYITPGERAPTTAHSLFRFAAPHSSRLGSAPSSIMPNRHPTSANILPSCVTPLFLYRTAHTPDRRTFDPIGWKLARGSAASSHLADQAPNAQWQAEQKESWQGSSGIAIDTTPHRISLRYSSQLLSAAPSSGSFTARVASSRLMPASTRRPRSVSPPPSTLANMPRIHTHAAADDRRSHAASTMQPSTFLPALRHAGSASEVSSSVRVRSSSSTSHCRNARKSTSPSRPAEVVLFDDNFFHHAHGEAVREAEAEAEARRQQQLRDFAAMLALTKEHAAHIPLPPSSDAPTRGRSRAHFRLQSRPHSECKLSEGYGTKEKEMHASVLIDSNPSSSTTTMPGPATHPPSPTHHSPTRIATDVIPKPSNPPPPRLPMHPSRQSSSSQPASDAPRLFLVSSTTLKRAHVHDPSFPFQLPLDAVWAARPTSNPVAGGEQHAHVSHSARPAYTKNTTQPARISNRRGSLTSRSQTNDASSSRFRGVLDGSSYGSSPTVTHGSESARPIRLGGRISSIGVVSAAVTAATPESSTVHSSRRHMHRACGVRSLSARVPEYIIKAMDRRYTAPSRPVEFPRRVAREFGREELRLVATRIIRETDQDKRTARRVTGLPRQLFLLDDEVVSDTEGYARVHVMIEDVVLMKAKPYDVWSLEDADRRAWQQQQRAIELRRRVNQLISEIRSQRYERDLVA